MEVTKKNNKKQSEPPEQNINQKNSFFYKLSSFILNYKLIFIVLFTCLSVGSVFMLDKVTIQSDLSLYLREDSLTRSGLELMNEEFAPVVSADLMIKNIDYDTSLLIFENLNQNKDILKVTFDSSCYKENSAIYTLNFDPNNITDDDIINILDAVYNDISINFLSNTLDSQIIIDSEAYNNDIDDLNAEMTMILGLAVVIISLILVFTSKSFAEIPILLYVFGVAALINKGTNFIFGDISFISDSIGIILQLALAIDYALILVHRYTEERELIDPDEACKLALSKAIPEVSASSLTTICGLIALSFMSYKLGYDMAKILIKSIIISLICVFTLLPSLLVIFDNAIQKTSHKNFVPSISTLCNNSLKSFVVIIPIFLVITAVAYVFSSKTDYFFYEGTSNLDTENSKYQINSIFGESNDLVIMVPNTKSSLINKFVPDLLKFEEVRSVFSFDTLELAEGINLETPINYVQGANFVGVTPEIAYSIFANYAMSINEVQDYERTSETYTIPIIDLLYFLDSIKDSGAIPQEFVPNIVTQVAMIETLRDNLISENYNRILVSINMPIESEETFIFMDDLIKLLDKFFPENYYLIGQSVNSYELYNVFQQDKLIVSGVSAVFIAIILLATFKSLAICLSMIFAIQSAIFINFAFPYFQNESLFFIGYLIVVAIQMGANIDYAIVITNRYKQLKNSMPAKEALVKATDMGFITVITSGSILCIAGLILNKISSDVVISSLGGCIARGTLISMIIVIFILPQFLYVEHLVSSYEPEN